MKRSQSSTLISIGLLSLAALLILAQFAFPQASSGGGWCKPSLDAPTEQGFYAYQFKSYGFPIPLVTVVKEECFREPVLTYEWSPSGIIVDVLLLIIPLSIWFRRNHVSQHGMM